MKRPVFFIAVGMVLALVLIAGAVIFASNAMANTRLRELGNGDIDVTITLSQPATMPAGSSGSRAGDALLQRELKYEEKLREMVRMAQTVTPTAIEPDSTDASTATPTMLPSATRRILVTPLPTSIRSPAPTGQQQEDRHEPEDTPAPAPTEDHDDGADNDRDDGNVSPSPINTPEPEDPQDDSGNDDLDD